MGVHASDESYRQARDWLLSVAPGNDLVWYQVVGAVMAHETSNGRGWHGAGEGSNNMGAIQCQHGPPCGSDCFETIDKHPDGSEYRGCFRIYATPEEGVADVVHQLVGRSNKQQLAEVLAAPNIDGNISADDVAIAMHTMGYFEGVGATIEERIDPYAHALAACAAEMAAALGEDLCVFRTSDMPDCPSGGDPSIPGCSMANDSGPSFSRVVGLGILFYGIYRFANA